MTGDVTRDGAPRPPRRVVVGLDRDGKSSVTDDDAAPLSSTRPHGLVVTEMWRASPVPTSLTARPDESDGLLPPPPPEGVTVRVATFPPDSSISVESAAAYERAAADLYGHDAGGPARRVPGMHRTDTVDVLTVVEGELWVVTETDEALLRAGDTIVQQGTWHAWQNRSDRACTVVSTMIAGRP